MIRVRRVVAAAEAAELKAVETAEHRQVPAKTHRKPVATSPTSADSPEAQAVRERGPAVCRHRCLGRLL